MKSIISADVGHLTPFYTVSLPFELSTGKYAVIRWKPTSKQSTSFNFAEGHDFNCKILFHFNPRIGENTIVRNTKDGGWGHEERPGGIPIQENVACEIKLVVRDECYECFVDGVKYCDYNHRLPVNIAKAFFFSGDGELYSVTFGDEAADQAAADCKEITLPCTKPCKVFPGCKIYYSGVPKSNGKNIRALLLADEDYAISFAARMKDDVVIINSKVGGSWGSEQKHTEFPFKVGEFFNICIDVATDKFKVSVNDQPYADFNHRLLPLSKINSLQVEGDVKVCCVCEGTLSNLA